MQSFLIVKTSAIGDVIQTFPVVEYLRQRFPSARIDWAVERSCSALASSHPEVDHVISIDTKKWRKGLTDTKTWQEIKAFRSGLQATHYDALFDLQGNTKSILVTALAKARDKVGFAFHSVPEKPNLLFTTRRFETPTGVNVRQRYLKLVQDYFGDPEVFIPKGVKLGLSEAEQERLRSSLQFPGKKLMVAFASKWQNKQLSFETLLALLQRIDAESAPFFLFIYGNAEEKMVADKLHHYFPTRSSPIGELTLPLWQALMGEVDGVMAMDSAALHLCGTTATPSLSFFGPSMASLYQPLGKQHHVLQGNCPYGKTFTTRCPILRTCKTGACLRELPVEDLFASFKSWWQAVCE